MNNSPVITRNSEWMNEHVYEWTNERKKNGWINGLMDEWFGLINVLLLSWSMDSNDSYQSLLSVSPIICLLLHISVLLPPSLLSNAHVSQQRPTSLEATPSRLICRILS